MGVINVCCLSDPLAKDFLNLIGSFNLLQHVDGPTHIHGHTLDLVLSHFNVLLDDLAFSDHKSVTFEIFVNHEIKKAVHFYTLGN